MIDEFPFFSYLLGDLHPHILATPFALLTIAVALLALAAGKGVRAFQAWQTMAQAELTPPADSNESLLEKALAQDKEVAEALWTPLLPLYRGEADTVRPYQWHGTEIDFPAYDVDGRVVWGLTYQMLRSFFRILG